MKQPKYKYLPEATSNAEVLPEPPPSEEASGIYPCPCCGYHTFPVPKEEALAYICPVCFWENDLFITSDEEPSDQNHGMTLNEGRKNYQSFGACTKAMLIHVRKPRPNEFPT